MWVVIKQERKNFPQIFDEIKNTLIIIENIQLFMIQVY